MAIFNTRLPEYQICRRSENFNHKSKQSNFDVKKCTLIFLKSGGAEADFVDRLTVAPPTQQSRRLEDVLQAPSKKSVHRVRHDHIEEDTEQLRAS